MLASDHMPYGSRIHGANFNLPHVIHLVSTDCVQVKDREVVVVVVVVVIISLYIATDQAVNEQL